MDLCDESRPTEVGMTSKKYTRHLWMLIVTFAMGTNYIFMCRT